MGRFLERSGGAWCLVAALAISSAAAYGSWCFSSVDGELYDRLTRDAGFKGPAGVSRDDSGTKLFLTGQTADGGTLVKIISQQGVRLERFASGRPVVDDNGKLIAWVTNLHQGASAAGVVKGLCFAAGDVIPIVFTNAFPATFEFSPGGDYLLLDEPTIPVAMLPGWTSAPQPVPFLTPSSTNMGGYTTRWQAVFRTSLPTKPLFRLPYDFYARAIFARSNQIVVSGFKFVFGAGSKSGRPELEKHAAWALIFSEDSSGYSLAKQLDLSRFVGVLDVDPATGMMLVRAKGEMFASWGQFDPKTGKYKSLGHAGAHGLFLDCEFSKYLGNRFR